MTAYEVRSSEVVYDGMLSRMRVDQVEMPDGVTAAREVTEHVDAVAAVPVTSDGQVVFVRQFRHPIRSEQLEIPAGILDHEGEERAAAARRELAEEVRLAAGRLEPLLTFFNSPGWTDEGTTVYLALDLEPTDAPDDFVLEAEEAEMETITLPLDEALARVDAGEIEDAKTVLGLLLADRWLRLHQA